MSNLKIKNKKCSGNETFLYYENTPLLQRGKQQQQQQTRETERETFAKEMNG